MPVLRQIDGQEDDEGGEDGERIAEIRLRLAGPPVIGILLNSATS